MRRTIARAAALAALLGAGLAVVQRARFERTVSRAVRALETGAPPTEPRRYSSDDVAGLPAPVRRYFDHVLPAGQPAVVAAEIHQRGTFRMGDAAGSWKPFEATQRFSTRPPGFVWDARIELVPGVAVRVLDAYTQGTGTLRANLLSAFPVAGASPSPALNEGELLRYLAESVWFPTALLPSAGVSWEPIDDRSARATLEDWGTTASLVFHFDGDEVERVHTDRRYRQETDSYQPWTGWFRDYRVENGMRIPGTAEVAWTPPEGPEPYWRARIDDIHYSFADEAD